MSTESKLGVYDGWYRSGDPEGLGEPDEIEKRLRSLGFHTYDDAIRGSLEVGKLADLVILDADLMNVSEEDLLEMGSRVLLTVVGGESIYTKPGFALEALNR